MDPRSNRLRLFVVDDDADVRLILAAALEAAGYEVSTSSTTLRIVNEVKQNQPDLVLLDYSMPGFKGTEAIRLLKQMMERCSLPEIPIALMSTDAPGAVLTEARESGAIAYVDKKMGPDGICQAVAAILTDQLRVSA